ncbi:hypothetical protein MKEN_01358800 [Mycena kentingensis (nom. inval.)]|nr:hypothetical protein MKEN_01358800 [Mycena kentingensis (nom. inval.)]
MVSVRLLSLVTLAMSVASTSAAPSLYAFRAATRGLQSRQDSEPKKPVAACDQICALIDAARVAADERAAQAVAADSNEGVLRRAEEACQCDGSAAAAPASEGTPDNAEESESADDAADSEEAGLGEAPVDSDAPAPEEEPAPAADEEPTPAADGEAVGDDAAASPAEDESAVEEGVAEAAAPELNEAVDTGIDTEIPVKDKGPLSDEEIAALREGVATGDNPRLEIIRTR